MPSDIAKQIVDRIFGDEKSKAVDLTNDALASATYDAIQARKLEYAKTMGFDLDDTAQDSADQVADQLPDGTEEPETVEVDGRAPEDPPESESEVETTDTPEEETTDETDQ